MGLGISIAVDGSADAELADLCPRCVSRLGLEAEEDPEIIAEIKTLLDGHDVAG